MHRPITHHAATGHPQRTATFRVPISLRVHDTSGCCTIGAAERILREDLDEVQHAALDGAPYGWTVHRERPDGGGYATVHAVMRLTITVPAHDSAPNATAHALLEDDLNQLSEIDADLDNITEIDADTADGAPGNDWPGTPDETDESAEHSGWLESDDDLGDVDDEQGDGPSRRTVNRRRPHDQPDSNELGELDLFDEHVTSHARCTDGCRP